MPIVASKLILLVAFIHALLENACGQRIITAHDYCDIDEYQCKTGQCVDISLVCNGVMNCPEGSDEDPLICEDKIPKQSACGHHIGDGSSGIADFPWHATIYKLKKVGLQDVKLEAICGATIIDNKFLLTAAHCVYDEITQKPLSTDSFLISTGNLYSDWYSHREDYRDTVRKSRVQNIHVHCEYRGRDGNYSSNIALLELPQHIKKSLVLIEPVCFDVSNAGGKIPDVDTAGTVTGFGRTTTSPIAVILQILTAPYVPLDECRGALKPKDRYLLTSDKFCAGYTNGSAVSDGDNGGGLIFTKDGTSYVAGIVSVLSNDIYTYGIYTRVQDYVQWIRDILAYVERDGPYPLCTGAK